MAVQSPNPVRTPVPSPQRRRQPPVDGAPRQAASAEPASARPIADAPPARPEPLGAVPGPSPSGWGGTAVLVVPAAGLFAVVAAVVVVNEINQTWTLVLSMAVVVFTTLCVAATIARMLNGEDD